MFILIEFKLKDDSFFKTFLQVIVLCNKTHGSFQQSRRVPGSRREIQANETQKVGCTVFYVTGRGRSPVRSQHFLTLPKATHNIPPVTARGARTHTHTYTHTRARCESGTACARAADFLHNVRRSENGRTRNSRLEQLL